MWPWGHAAVGYLVYVAFRRLRGDRWPADDTATVALAIGTQFPDLVDKPLAWSFSILPSGRSLAHSLLIGSVFLAVVLVVAKRYDRSEPAVAFAVGYCAHLFGDALLPLLRLDFAFLSFLGWPLLTLPPYESDSSFLAHILALRPEPFTVFGFLLTLGTIGLWIRDGYPGLRWLRDDHSLVPSDD
jgi:membrane-bound metal-dependent hydrolase YbcI (DUF457 family)